MERNTQTEVKNLLPGDRFYKVGDKQKAVLEIVRDKLNPTKICAKKDNQLHPETIKDYTQVVFLRHADSGI